VMEEGVAVSGAGTTFSEDRGSDSPGGCDTRHDDEAHRT
jgi:hypothetical protein